jgi:hypothetical protein
MSKLLVTLFVSMATIGLNAAAAAADNVDMPHVQIAEKRAGSAGPIAAPGGNISKPSAFPSSSAAGVSHSNPNRNEEYSAAIRNCESLPRSQRRACIDETKKRFGQM